VKRKDSDERIAFQAEAMTLKAEINIEYEFSTVDDDRRKMYVYFKRTPQEIEEQFMKKDIVSAFNTVSQTLSVEDVYSTRKDSVRIAVQQIVRDKYAPYGIHIKEVAYMSPIDVPEEVRETINAKITATQEAQRRENEVASERAEAMKKIERARGEAESIKIAAQGRAEAIDIEGEALRRNPDILKLKRIETQAIAAKSAENWNDPVLAADQASILLGLGKE
jgi:regulator of protease activity HflC (stomatin/prohibitin superfamily)